MNTNSYQETILIDDEYFRMLIQDINAAKNTIDMEVYIFADDRIGNELANALIKASQQGVKIRLLVDGVGTRDGKNLRLRMEKTGIQIKFYHPLFWSLFQWPLRLDLFKNVIHFVTHMNSRNHRKTCTIDNKIAYIGSANIIEYAYHLEADHKWHDVTVRITGLPLDPLVIAFNKAWECISFKPKLKRFYENKLESVFRLNYSWRRRHNLYKSLLNRIEHCQTRIWITSAYFIPPRFLLFRLIKAARKGIPVSIVIPKNPDVMGISLLMSSFFYILLKSGVEIFQHRPGVLHAKFLIIDDWFCVGSSNLNFRSFYHDLEADVIIQTPVAKHQLETLFNDYRKHADKITLNDIKKLTAFQKIAIKCLWRIRFLF